MDKLFSFLGKEPACSFPALSPRQIEQLCDGDLARKDPRLRRQVTLEQVLRSTSPSFGPFRFLARFARPAARPRA